MNFFKPVFKQAKELSSAYEGSQTTKIPFVTVSEPIVCRQYVGLKNIHNLLLECGMGLTVTVLALFPGQFLSFHVALEWGHSNMCCGIARDIHVLPQKEARFFCSKTTATGVKKCT